MTADVVHADSLALMDSWARDGISFGCCITDPPYHLDSISKRFGKEGSAPARRGRDGAAARLSRGFMGSPTDAGDVSFRPDTWGRVLRVLEPGARLACFGGTRTWWRTAAAIDAAGFEIEDTIMWAYGQGLVLRRSRLKPCVEPIILARAPGGPVRDLNIDACRITDGSRTLSAASGGNRDGESSRDRKYDGNGATDFAARPGPRGGDARGRWPGNLIHDGSDEVLACLPDAPGQLARASDDRNESPRTLRAYGRMGRADAPMEPRGDSGSAARFFARCEFAEDERDLQRIVYAAKAPSGERCFRCGICGEDAVGTRESRRAHLHGLDSEDHLRSHPTVKPLSLMRHLARLLCPAGGTLLDPFCGTGSTVVAAALEGFDAIGVEADETFAAHAAMRIQLTKAAA